MVEPVHRAGVSGGKCGSCAPGDWAMQELQGWCLRGEVSGA